MENKELTVNQINGRIKRCEENIILIKKNIEQWQNTVDNPYKWATESDIKGWKNIVRDLQKKLNKEEAKLAEFKGMLVGKVKEYPEVRQFVETWKTVCIAHITDPQTIADCIESYKTMKQHQKEIEEEYKARGCKSWESYNERNDIEKSFLRTWDFVWNYLDRNNQIDMERLERDYKYEADRKYNKFIEDAEFYVGEITDTKELSVGKKGDLNGWVTGKKGKAEVETISACGMIQRFHYRTIFKMAK